MDIFASEHGDGSDAEFTARAQQNKETKRNFYFVGGVIMQLLSILPLAAASSSTSTLVFALPYPLRPVDHRFGLSSLPFASGPRESVTTDTGTTRAPVLSSVEEFRA